MKWKGAGFYRLNAQGAWYVFFNEPPCGSFRTEKIKIIFSKKLDSIFKLHSHHKDAVYSAGSQTFCQCSSGLSTFPVHDSHQVAIDLKKLHSNFICKSRI